MIQAREGIISTREAFNLVHRQAERRPILVEGSPLYLYPNPAYPSQQWDNQALVQGWRFIDVLQTTLVPTPARPIFQWTLVDDFNNRPVGEIRPTPEHVVARVARESERMREIFAFLSIPRDFAEGRGMWESEAAQMGGPQECFNMDSHFQARKLTQALEHALRDCDTQKARPAEVTELLLAHPPLLLIVHPVERFQDQQSRMLNYLLGKMRGGFYDKIPKRERRELLSRVYEHVWLNNQGEISGITHPVWNEGRAVFDHQEVEID